MTLDEAVAHCALLGHDLRARWHEPFGEDGVYHAVCQECGYNAGIIDVTGWEIIMGTATIRQPRPIGTIQPHAC